MHLSIIIPVLNEEDLLYQAVAHLEASVSNFHSVSVDIIDGGSRDETKSEATRVQKFLDREGFVIRFRESDIKGRASQMNLGAKLAQQKIKPSTNHILYFLHVDSHPPKNFDQHIVKAVTDGHSAGCFRMKFDSSHWWLKLMGWFTRFDWKASRGGDQSQFITSVLFNELGGYDEQYPVYEDYELIKELYARNEFYVIPKWLTTSARRYESIGVLQLQWFYLNIYWKKFRGAPTDELHAYYQRTCQKSISQ